ncbi:MAG: sugar phosphate isomerase/epimerase [Gemmatimonadota bacterium]
MQRRDFIAAAAALCGMPAQVVQASRLTERKLDRIGIQLYSVRDAAQKDFEGTLAGLASYGYRTIELLDSVGNFGKSAAQIRPMLDRHGLRAPSTHAASKFITTDFEANLDRAKTIGHEYVIIAGFSGEESKTLDDYRAWADRFNRAGEIARKTGVWIGFHNHAGDFALKDGQVPYDVLMDRVDPAIVRMQLDVGNLASHGADPLEYLRRYGNRYWSFHIKDIAKPPAKGFAELGQGALDFKRILASIERIEQKHIFVEQENYELSSMEHARRNFDYLSKLDF